MKKTARVTSLGQACIVVDTGDYKIGCDPWFSGPVWLGASVPYPLFTEAEQAEAHAMLDSCQALYISHDHEDHWDPVFLRTLSPKKIFVGAFRNKRFCDRLRALEPQHEIHFVPHRQVIEPHPSLTMCLYLEQPPYRTNSMCLFSTPYGKILNGNDCGLDLQVMEDVARLREDNEALLFYYTINHLAAGYPIPYLRKWHPDAIERMDRIRDDVEAKTRAAIATLDPTATILFAGPNVYVDSVNDYFNDLEDARNWTMTQDRLGGRTKVLWPTPFSAIDIADGEIELGNRSAWPDFAGRPLKPDYDAESDPYAGAASRAEVLSQAKAFQSEIRGIAEDLEVSFDSDLILSSVAGFEAIESDRADWSLRIYLRENRDPEFVAAADRAEPYIEAITTGQVILKFLAGEVTWNLFYGGRARLARSPDRFDENLHQVLTFGRDPSSRAALAEWMESKRRTVVEETITIAYRGKQHEIVRFCPHEGEDLSKAEIVDGYIICPRHRWRFDIETGKCIAGNKKASIKPRPTAGQ